MALSNSLSEKPFVIIFLNFSFSSSVSNSQPFKPVKSCRYFCLSRGKVGFGGFFFSFSHFLKQSWELKKKSFPSQVDLNLVPGALLFLPQHFPPQTAQLGISFKHC